MKKVLFVDRDGTLIKETEDEQIDAIDKLVFYPKALYYMYQSGRIRDSFSSRRKLLANS
jgi:histidinol phosphatase-like enzyme